ncbi:secreted RxLR effector protein 161-like [Lathyrus oleraceus]|uniref:secreted RxLR effector protein 161-like n=1 Tax=Pisum sativum TaxID=3888 RepID=UPI0021D1A9B1|nr:secreted RxLR effector protein 161-like [Pisum sativum]
MVYFIGMKIMYYNKDINLHKLKYELELLKRFELMDYKSAITPVEINHKLDFDVKGDDANATTFKHLIDALRYLYNTRPDIYRAVRMVSRFMNKSKWSHYQANVRILRCIKWTLKYEVLFLSDVEIDSKLICYSDSDWCGDKVDRRSTFRYLFKYLGGPISWCSKKKPVIALSTYEVEYIAGALTTCQAA